MKNYLKSFGNGAIYGVKHPFKDAPMSRYEDMTIIETMCDAYGSAIVQNMIAYGIFVIALIGIGYASNKIKNQPVKVKMVVDK